MNVFCGDDVKKDDQRYKGEGRRIEVDTPLKQFDRLSVKAVRRFCGGVGTDSRN